MRASGLRVSLVLLGAGLGLIRESRSRNGRLPISPRGITGYQSGRPILGRVLGWACPEAENCPNRWWGPRGRLQVNLLFLPLYCVIAIRCAPSLSLGPRFSSRVFFFIVDGTCQCKPGQSLPRGYGTLSQGLGRSGSRWPGMVTFMLLIGLLLRRYGCPMSALHGPRQ